MSIIKEFKKFALRGNVIDLSIGVILGTAFGQIVTAVVEDLVMPIVHPLLAQTKGHWASMVIGPGIKIGHFLSAVLNFFIISLVVFALVKVIHSLKQSEEKSEEKSESQSLNTTHKLLMEIRDALKK